MPQRPDHSNEVDLPKVLGNLFMKDAIDELHLANKSFREGKSSGHENIAPKILKSFNLMKKFLMENTKSNLLSELVLLPRSKSEVSIKQRTTEV